MRRTKINTYSCCSLGRGPVRDLREERDRGFDGGPERLHHVQRPGVQFNRHLRTALTRALTLALTHYQKTINITLSTRKHVPKRVLNPCLNLRPNSSLKFQMSIELHPRVFSASMIIKSIVYEKEQRLKARKRSVLMTQVKCLAKMSRLTRITRIRPVHSLCTLNLFYKGQMEF